MLSLLSLLSFLFFYNNRDNLGQLVCMLSLLSLLSFLFLQQQGQLRTTCFDVISAVVFIFYNNRNNLEQLVFYVVSVVFVVVFIFYNNRDNLGQLVCMLSLLSLLSFLLFYNNRDNLEQLFLCCLCYRCSLKTGFHPSFSLSRMSRNKSPSSYAMARKRKMWSKRFSESASTLIFCDLLRLTTLFAKVHLLFGYSKELLVYLCLGLYYLGLFATVLP